MKKIKLNERINSRTSNDGYELDSTEKYIVDIESEIEFQAAIMMSFQVMGPLPAIIMRGYLKTVSMWRCLIQQMRLSHLIMESNRSGKLLTLKVLS